MTTAFIVAVVVYLLGAAADWYTTKRLLYDRARSRTRPRAKEANPFLRWVLGDPDPRDEWRLAAVKLGVLGAILVASRRYGFDAESSLLALGAVQGAVAISNKWNLLGRLIRRLRAK